MLTLPEGHRPELLGHAVLGDHLARELRGPLDVVAGARGDIADGDRLGHPPAQHHRDLVEHLAPGGEELVLHREREGVAERPSAADDADLVDRIGVGQHVSHERVTRLVVGDDPLLLVGDDAALALRAGDDPLDRVLELHHVDGLLAVTRGQQRRLVHQVGQVGAGESGRASGQDLEVDVVTERLASGVDLEDLVPALEVGTVDHDLPVEATGAQQRRIKHVRAVGRRHDDDVVLDVETVHLHEQLVQRLLTLVVTTAESGAAHAAHGVELVDEDDAGAGGLRLLEQVAYAARANAHEHLHEVGTRDREERHARLTGHGAREQRLTGTRRAYQKHALGDLRAESLELAGIAEELLDLLELLHRLVHACHILERDARLITRDALRPALPERHHLGVAALHLVDEPEHHDHDDHDRDERGEQAQPDLVVLHVDRVALVRLVSLEILRERGAVQVVGDEHLVLALCQRVVVGIVLPFDLLAAREDLGAHHTPSLQRGGELRVAQLVGHTRGLQRVREEQQAEHDEEQIEQGRPEITVHA